MNDRKKIIKEEEYFLLDKYGVTKKYNFICDEEKKCFFLEKEELADYLRDDCGELLQIIGFEKDYSITKEGEILEGLIDKLFLGEEKNGE